MWDVNVVKIYIREIEIFYGYLNLCYIVRSICIYKIKNWLIIIIYVVCDMYI